MDKKEYFRNTVLPRLMDIVPFSLIKRLGSRKLIILYYHLVSDEDVPHVRYLYKFKDTSQFISDLEFLLKHYSPTGLMDLIRCEKGDNNLPRNPFHLTFDDGFREIYDVIAPILLEKGIPATFFISSAFLDNVELCYEHKASLLIERFNDGLSAGSAEEVRGILGRIGIHSPRPSEGILKVDYRRREALDRIAAAMQIDFQRYLNEKQPYLTTGQIKELIDRGFTIGSHSIDHPYYSDLPLAEQLEQTVGSVRRIRQIFGLNYGAFAFPHNDTGVPPAFFKKTQESGLIDITFGTGGFIEGGLQMHRQRISLEKPVMHARNLIAWQYARRLYRQLTEPK